MWVSLTRGQVALQSLGNGWHTFLYISLTIIILSLKFYSMKRRSSISVEKITVGNLRLKKKKKAKVTSLTQIYFWNLHAGRNPQTIIKAKIFHSCSFSFARASEMFSVLNGAEMNNVHYLFNNSCICSVPCLFLCILVLLTWTCRAGKNCYILRTIAKQQGKK